MILDTSGLLEANIPSSLTTATYLHLSFPHQPPPHPPLLTPSTLPLAPLQIRHLSPLDTRHPTFVVLPEVEHPPYRQFHLAFHKYTCLAEEPRWKGRQNVHVPRLRI